MVGDRTCSFSIREDSTMAILSLTWLTASRSLCCSTSLYVSLPRTHNNTQQVFVTQAQLLQDQSHNKNNSSKAGSMLMPHRSWAVLLVHKKLRVSLVSHNLHFGFQLRCLRLHCCSLLTKMIAFTLQS